MKFYAFDSSAFVTVCFFRKHLYPIQLKWELAWVNERKPLRKCDAIFNGECDRHCNQSEKRQENCLTLLCSVGAHKRLCRQLPATCSCALWQDRQTFFRALRSSGYFYQVMAASWLEIKKLHLFSLRHATKPNTEMLMVLGHIFPAHKAVKAKESVRNDRILLYLWRISAVAVAVHDRACRLERSRGGSMVAYNHVTKTRAPLCSFAKLFHAPPKPQLMRLDSRVGLRW